MKKSNGAIPIFKWIWKNYLKTSLIPAVLIAILFFSVYFLTNSWSQNKMTSFLKTEVNDELLQTAEIGSNVIEQQLLGIEYITKTYTAQNRLALISENKLSEEDAARLSYTENGIYYTTNDTVKGGAAVFYSGAVPVNEAERKKVIRLLATQELMKDIQQSNPLVASLYFNTFDSLNVIYPYFDVVEQYAPHMDIPTFNFYYEADATHNPERVVKWTDVYLDPAGHGWMASCIAPVYNGDFLEGVAGIDLTVGTITKQVLNMEIPWGGYGILVGKDGTILALPEDGENDWGLSELTDHTYEEAIMQDTYKPDQFNLFKRDELNDFATNLQSDSSGFSSFTLNGDAKVASWNTISETGWKLILIVPEQNIYAQVEATGTQLFRIGLIMIAILIFVYSIIMTILFKQSRKMCLNISMPLSKINTIVGKIGSGEYYQEQEDFDVKEIQETANIVIKMGHQLGDANNELLSAQEKIRENEAYLQALVKSIDDVVLEVDENGVFKNIRTSDEDNLVIGFTKGETQTVFNLLNPEKAEEYLNCIKEVIATGNPATIEYQLTTPKGLRWFQGRIALILNNSRTVAVSSRDITEQKELSNSVIIARDEAEKASLAKTQFLSNMSHELRTPLNAVLGFAQVLELDPSEPLTKSQGECVNEIEKAGSHLLELINEVLDLAKIESGKISISIEPTSVSLIMEETLSLILPMAHKYNITINSNIVHCQKYVFADKVRIKQVLLNLLSNAIKYNKENGTIDFYCEQVGNNILFHVVDTGIGISEQELQLIFEPFHRSSTTKNSVEGTGIGLSMVKQLMELMKGKTHVESTVGIGSHFYVELPLSDTKIADEEDIPKKLNQLLKSNSGTSNKVILYVEDNPANLNLVERLLKQVEGTQLISSSTGELGIDLALAHKPDLILLDINLPGIDGYETLKRLQGYETTASIPVIAVSANAMEKSIQYALSIGFNDYITKPINVIELLDKIKNILT